ncbi:hypothetical protein [Pseudomonas sp. TMP9]|uniref:hypothetical protein n=1 Tax=Pseudomonas sp. TMP9 TaxID=3133144 RepID=UPI0030D065F5
MRFLISFCFLFFTSSFAYASDYYWQRANGSVYDNPTAACQAWEATHITLGGNNRFTGLIWYSPDFVGCQINNSTGRSETIRRYGTSCPTDSTYNTETGECESPKPNECEAKSGESTTFTKSGTAPDAYAVVLPSGQLGQEQSACFSSCVVSTTEQKCTVNGIGNYTCRGKAYYTGQKCTTGPEVDYTDSPKEPEPETITKDKPCQYIEQADGTLRCDSEKSTEKEGQSCGTVNGVKKCFDTKPTKDAVNIETDVKTETKPDGSSTITKTDTATKTTCSGINSCSSITTKTTTKTEKDADGNTTSISGTCTGSSCPDKNTNPDGDGDGFGDCTDGNCSSGAGGPLETPELEEVPGFSETTSTFTGRIAAAPIMTAIKGIRLNGGGSCSMSGTTTIIGSVSASAFCDNSSWLDPLYFVFLAIHALAAVRVFLSA